ncbi:MAG TPA: hypothetical protein VMN37_12610 [Gemmatimonadales bacterium]|nr:hypothetical protein [Gemmatimonadales bacterium]
MSRPSRPDLWSGFSPAEPVMLAAVLVAAVAVRVHVITQFNVNWDEFQYLSLVHDYIRGTLDLELQAFHVHFFRWLPLAGTNEVDQVVAARAVMLGLHLLTAGLLYGIARRATSAPAAWFAVAAYLALSFGIRGGASFRTDPIATTLVMAALYLLLTRRSVPGALLAGLLLGIAGMFTIKAAVFLPTCAVILAAPAVARRDPREAVRGLAMGLGITAGFALLYRLHADALPAPLGRASLEIATASLSKTVVTAGFLPQPRVLAATLSWDLVFWAFWLAGAGIVARRIHRARGSERLRWIEVISLALPVASLALYRNSFPYFYPTILAPASVLVAVAWHSLASRAARQPGRVKLAAARIALGWFAASLIVHGIYVPRRMPAAHQRQVIEVVHRTFPRPVPYLDRSSAIASFPQAGFFMSTWGLEAYADRGHPVLRQAILEEGPPLLIANHPLLDVEHALFPPARHEPDLLPADREAVSAAYIHHWGPIYVAGRRVAAGEGDAARRFELLIPGRYTLEANGEVRIDGRPVRPGQSLELASGHHELDAPAAGGTVTLRWGEGLYRPPWPPPALEFFLGF